MTTFTKKPIQIYLRQEQLDALRALARHRSVSMAKLVRQAIDRLLDEVPVEEDPALNMIGSFDSGLGDLAEKHDEYLTQMIAKENY
jgi:hypothetical protein